MDIFYNKAMNNFNMLDKKIKEDINLNIKYGIYIRTINGFVQDYEKIYLDNIPKKGIMVLNHNDCYSLNFMMRQTDKKMFIIDNEFASLNLVGYDMAYYVYESHYNYDNIRNCIIPRINIDKCFNDYYLKYINEFIKNNECYINECGNIFNEIKTKKYYIRLCLLTNLFLFIYVLASISLDKLEKKKDDDLSLLDVVYRCNLYNYYKKELDQII